MHLAASRRPPRRETPPPIAFMLPGGCCWNRDKHGSMPASALQSGGSPGSLSIQPQPPKVGVGVLIFCGSSVLLGKRRGSAGAGTWATPGGHLEFGESWAQCAVREVHEETGLTVTDVRFGTVLNVIDEPTGYHYVTIFMVATADPADAEPVNAEPDKCEGWHWCDWSADLPAPLFKTLKTLRATGFDPLLSPRSPGASDDAIVEAATEGLRALCDAAGIDESHGVKHARSVLAHAEQALAAAPTLTLTLTPTLTLTVALALALARTPTLTLTLTLTLTRTRRWPPSRRCRRRVHSRSASPRCCTTRTTPSTSPARPRHTPTPRASWTRWACRAPPRPTRYA